MLNTIDKLLRSTKEFYLKRQYILRAIKACKREIGEWEPADTLYQIFKEMPHQWYKYARWQETL